MAISLLMGVVYLAVAQPKYQVESRLLVERRGQPLDDERTDLTAKDFLPTQAEIIRSPAVIKRASDSLAFPNGSEEDSPVVSILARLEVEPLLGTSVLSLLFHDPDPTQTVETVKTIIDSYEEYLQDSEQASHRQTITLVTIREQELRMEIRRLQEEYAELRANSPVLGLDPDVAQVQHASLTSLSETLTTTKRRRIELENHLQMLDSLRPSALASTPDLTVPASLLSRPDYLDETGHAHWHTSLDVLARVIQAGLVSAEDPQPVQAALLAAEERDAELSKRFGPQHPAIKGVRNVVRTLEERLREQARMAPELLQRELLSLRGQEDGLSKLYNQEFEVAKTVDTFLVKEQHRLAEIERLQTAHETIEAELSTMLMADQAVSGGRASVTVSLLDGPELVDDFVWPQPVPLLGLCTLIGLAGGVLLVVAGHRRASPRSENS